MIPEDHLHSFCDHRIHSMSESMIPVDIVTICRNEYMISVNLDKIRLANV